MAISTFNEGASAMLSVMERLWLQSTVVTVNAMRETDRFRMSKSEAYATSMKQRRKCLSTAILNRHQLDRDEGPTYEAGMEN